MNDFATAIEKFLSTELAGAPELVEVQRDTDLLAADLIDSLGIMELVKFLEARFGIAVADEDLVPENFRSIDAITAFVARKTD
ncbi:MAG: acyl carrier protein [Solirubrobacterales bacterium]